MFFLWSCISLVICVVIFLFSSQDGIASGNASESVTRRVFAFVLDEKSIYILEKIIRKAAHYFIYFCLGISTCLALSYFYEGYLYKNIQFTNRLLYSGAFCFLYSLTDEYHQSFIPGRNGSFYDCLLDTAGALGGIVFVSSITYFISKCIKK